MIVDTASSSGRVGSQVIRIDEWHEAILAVLAGGWRRAAALRERVATEDEISLTQCLRQGMIADLRARKAAWCKRITILPGTESRSRSSTLKPDGLTDISVYLQDIRERYDEHDPHAIVECKRITEHDSALCRLYVVEGIDRFAIGKYSIKHAVGFMVGYVISGAVHRAVLKINGRLSREERQTEYLRELRVVQEAQAWISRHSRAKPYMPIELYHAFLVFDA